MMIAEQVEQRSGMGAVMKFSPIRVFLRLLAFTCLLLSIQSTAMAFRVPSIVLPTSGDQHATVIVKQAAHTLNFGLNSPNQITICNGCKGGESSDLGIYKDGTELVFFLTDTNCGVTNLSTNQTYAYIDQTDSTTWEIYFDDSGPSCDWIIPPSPTNFNVHAEVKLDASGFLAVVSPTSSSAITADQQLTFTGENSVYPTGAAPDFTWELVTAPASAKRKKTVLTGTAVTFSLADFVSNGVPGTYNFKMVMTSTDGSGQASEAPFTVLYAGLSDYCAASGVSCPDAPPISPIGTEDNSSGCSSDSPTAECPVGQPVNPSSGSMWHMFRDFAIAGRTRATRLHLDRFYLSNPGSTAGDFGPNWWHSYATRLERAGSSFAVKRSKKNLVRAVSTGDLVWIDEAGGPSIFKNQGNGTYTAPLGMNQVITEFPDHFELLKQDRTKLVFSKSPFGVLTKITEPHGESVTLTYDSSGKLSSVSTPLAGAVNFSRDSSGRIVQALRVRDNLAYTYTYGTDGRLASETDFAGLSYQYLYVTDRPGTKAQGMLAKIIDPLKRETVFTYNDNGAAYQQFEPGGGVRIFSYSSGQTAVTELDGVVHAYALDSALRVKNVTKAGITSESSHWAVDGRVDKRYSAMGGVTQLGHDGNGNLSSVQRPVDTAPTKATFDLTFNKPILIVPPVGASTSNSLDPNTGDILGVSRGGLTISYTRDPFGNLLSTNNGKTTYSDQRDANGLLTYKFDLHNPETRSYDGRFRLQKRAFQSGRILLYSYDDYDRITDVTDSDGPSSHIVYDAMGRLLQTSVTGNAITQTTKFTYDDRDRLVSINDALGRMTSYQYDPVRVMDKPISITDPAGRKTYFNYDSLQRLVKETDALGGTTTYTYDQNGNMTSVTDANGNVTAYYYDLNNRKVEEVRPSVAGTASVQLVRNFFYDSADHLVREVAKSATGGANRAINYTYDVLDRLVHRTTQREGTSISVDDDSAFTYGDQLDATLLTSATNGVSSLSFASEVAPPFALTGFQVKASQAGNPLGLIEGSFSISRDVTGEIGAVSKDGATIFTRTYSPAGRLLSVQAGSFSTGISYDGFGRKATVASSDGASGTLQYDLLNRPTASTWTGPTPISEQLTYDLAGNVNSLTRENGAYSIAYDAIDQIVNSTTTGSVNYNRAWTYDGVGNRLTDSANGPGSFTSNFLTANGVSTYLADPDGFGDVIRETTGSTVKNFVYRADDRLSGYSDGSNQAVYYYDALGRRAAKSVNGVAGNFTHSFVYLGLEDRILLAKAGDGSITTYLDGQGGNEHLGEIRNGVFRGYVTDHSGSVLNSDAAGNSHAFGPFGEIVSRPPSLSASSRPVMYGWQGLSYDAESGHWDNLARQYNQGTGAFSSQDFLGIEGGLNLYGSRRNNPLKFADFNGEDVTVIYYGGGAGHIGLSVNGGPSFGFYPNGGVTLSVFTSSVPGMEINDKYKQQGDDDVQTFTIKTTEEQDASILDYISRLAMHPGQYNAFGSGAPNCSNQAANALQTAGLWAPTTWRPGQFFQQIQQKYSPRNQQ